ncbi:uncharacterized protein [Rutidosis leptorrhynchoides]|uniref:uncharacterized protein n=1 Tax=Rutidosis leptorrhynchoides TaxID=125765 RepID=UPI003A9A4FE2
MGWNSSKRPTEVKSFLGLAGYYHRFIKDYSKIAGPLTKLTRKHVTFRWSGQQEQAFQNLKQLLCQAPVLVLPEGSYDFVKELNMRQRQWIKLIKDYDCELKYHQGKENVVADDLSHKKTVETVKFMRIEIVSDLVEQIKQVQAQALLEENLKTELMTKIKDQLTDDSRGLKMYKNRTWTDSQSGRTIQTLEDMLRSCVLEYSGSWDTHLPLIEFAYNNTYHLSIGMPPYEMLYGCKCRTLTCWLEAGEKQFTGPELVQITAENVAIAREKLKAARDRQKMYVDQHRRPVNFEVGDHVYLKVSLWKAVIRFFKRGKLAPRYIGAFKIIQRVNDQTIVLEISTELAGIQNIFNVCYLRKCKVDDETQLVPLSDLRVDLNQKLVEEPVRIFDRKVMKVRKKEIRMMLVEWKHSLGSNLTWKTEELMKAHYLRLFDQNQILRTKSS